LQYDLFSETLPILANCCEILLSEKTENNHNFVEFRHQLYQD